VVGHGIETNVAIVPPSPESHPVILFVGRITPRKNLACFVLTIYELRNRGLHVRGRIIGAMPDEAYIHNIRELITELGLSEIVSLEGPREHRALEEEYKHAAIMINSSETGSIDKVVLEAMAHGLPCVASASAYGELLGRFGLATAQQNPKLYADAVEHVLRMDEGTRMELAKMLRGEVVAHHSLSTLTNRIFSL
jgi:glycosyltransferase involved in cell wall biosynthesis